MLLAFKKYIREYGISNQKGFVSYMFDFLSSIIINYNHRKYWKRRRYVVDENKKIFY